MFDCIAIVTVRFACCWWCGCNVSVNLAFVEGDDCLGSVGGPGSTAVPSLPGALELWTLVGSWGGLGLFGVCSHTRMQHRAPYEDI